MKLEKKFKRDILEQFDIREDEDLITSISKIRIMFDLSAREFNEYYEYWRIH